jgi:hypothetical protein
MIDTADVYVGRFYGRHEFEVSPELVRKYSAGTGDWNPSYTGASEFGAAVAPALVLHSEVYRDVSWYLSVFGNPTPSKNGSCSTRSWWATACPQCAPSSIGM